MKIQLQDEMDEKERVHAKNLQLEAELKAIKKLERSVQKIDRSKRKLEEEFRAYKVDSDVVGVFRMQEWSQEICMVMFLFDAHRLKGKFTI